MNRFCLLNKISRNKTVGSGFINKESLSVNMTQIRNYQNQDYPQVREILERGNLYWEQSDNEQALERKIRQCPDSILVAVADGRVVGTQFIVEDFLPLIFELPQP